MKTFNMKEWYDTGYHITALEAVDFNEVDLKTLTEVYPLLYEEAVHAKGDMKARLYEVHRKVYEAKAKKLQARRLAND